MLWLPRPPSTTRPALAGLAALALGLSACSGDAATGTTPGTGDAPAQALGLEDGWAKADDGMTSAFGTLTNSGTQTLTVTGGSSPSAGRVEMHTMEDQNGAMVMVHDEDGFDIPAGGSHELSPGGDHIMLIDLTEPLPSGTEVTFTLTTQEGSEATFTVPVREFSGADEDYLPGEGHDSHEHAPAEDTGD